MAAAELSPLARTGGLGEAVAGLARALAGRGVELSVALPRYRGLPTAPAGPSALPAVGTGVLQQDGYRVLLIDDPESFDREGIYGPGPGTAYRDEWRRWGRFGAAVAELAAGMDVLHVHDSHPALAAAASAVPTVVTVHNASLSVVGPLAEVAADAPAAVGAMQWFGEASFLKGALEWAAAVTTVSPSYARQISGDDEVSSGLSRNFAALDPPLQGILNGIDVDAWDPQRDPTLPRRYAWSDLRGKEKCRAALVDGFGLRGGVVFGMVGRMTPQKGVDLLERGLDYLIDEGFRLVAVGSGELDPMLERWAGIHPRAVVHRPYDEELARLVYAGADAYLMPSRFEPCGLSQMYAMRYGTPPVVHLTGGLADTVVDAAEEGATGLGFRNATAGSLVAAVRRALHMRTAQPRRWHALQVEGMRRDWSWDKAAAEYVDVYRRAQTAG